MRDQYDDADRGQLFRLGKVINIPEFVKTASVSDPEDLKGLAPSSFGDPARRKFPLGSRHDAWLSRLYFAKNASMYKDAGERSAVRARIERAAGVWGLPAEYETNGGMPKKARQRFSIPIKAAGGCTLDSLVLDSPRDLEKAAIQIFDNKGLFTFDQRSSVARKMSQLPICKEAALRPDVAEYMEKAAGYGMASKSDLMAAVSSRALLYDKIDPAVAARASTLADKLAEASDLMPADLGKVAAVLGACDEACGLNRHYSRGLQTPEEAVFKWTCKTASEALRDGKVRLMNGRSVPIEKLSEEVLDRYFNDVQGEIPTGSHMDKLAMAASLPRPDADDLLKYAEVDDLNQESADGDRPPVDRDATGRDAAHKAGKAKRDYEEGRDEPAATDCTGKKASLLAMFAKAVTDD
jgi:hypothetical protein